MYTADRTNNVLKFKNLHSLVNCLQQNEHLTEYSWLNFFIAQKCVYGTGEESFYCIGPWNMLFVFTSIYVTVLVL